METKLGMVGFRPTVTIGKTERLKYEEIWKHPKYRETAPGEDLAMTYLQRVKPRKGETLIDFGCGTGRGGRFLAMMGGLNVVLMDFAKNALDEDVRKDVETYPDRLRWVQQDMLRPIKETARYGYCTDVLEHIPPGQLDTVLTNILNSARQTFFAISCEPDNLGALIGETLHMNVQPYSWWLDKFRQYRCNIMWSHDGGGNCLFLVSRWATGKSIHDIAGINITSEEVKANILVNLELGLQELKPHDPQDVEVMLLAGGPSLNDCWDEIADKRSRGVPLVTTNGAYNECVKRGLMPSAQKYCWKSAVVVGG